MAADMIGNFIWTVAVLVTFAVSLLPQPVLTSGAGLMNLVLIAAFIPSFFINRHRHYDKSDLLVLLFVFFACCSAFLAKDGLLALRRLSYSIFPIIPTYFIFKNLPDRECGKILRLIYILASVISVFCIIEFVTGKNFLYEYFIKNPYYGRRLYNHKVLATFYHPTIVGAYLTAAIPLSYLFVPESKSRAAKATLILSLLVNFTAVLFTFSKMAWLVTAMLVFIFISRVFNRPKAALIAAALTLILFIGCSLNYIRQDISEPRRLRNTLRYRANSYSVSSRIILRYPVFGIGPGHYRRDFMEYSDIEGTPDLVRVPDNNYMAILAEMGLAAFIPFILFAAALLKKITAVLRKAEQYAVGAVPVAVSLSLLGAFLSHVSYDAFYWVSPLVIFWLLAGILSGHA